MRQLIFLVLLLCVLVPSARSEAASPTFSATSYGNDIWTIWRDQYHYAFAFGWSDKEALISSLNATDACAYGCSGAPYPPCRRYTVVQQDLQTWAVYANYTDLVAEVNIQGDATAIRDSLRLTHSGGTCPIGR